MEKEIQQLIFNENAITWQSLLMDLVKREGMDPWNLDISKLANSYVKSVQKLKEANLRVSGKVVLASALLLKVKSKRLVAEDLSNLDNLFARTQEEAMLLEDFDDNMDLLNHTIDEFQDAKLLPRTPQPRKRKVSVYDLVEAMDKAMNVRRNRIKRNMPYVKKKIELPSGIDIGDIIFNVYGEIKDFFKKGKKGLTFSKLLPADDIQSKVFTFIPLLHLHNERRVDIQQKEHFGDIDIKLIRGRKAS
jgi:segregation and condensation protein A